MTSNDNSSQAIDKKQINANLKALLDPIVEKNDDLVGCFMFLAVLGGSIWFFWFFLEIPWWSALGGIFCSSLVIGGLSLMMYVSPEVKQAGRQFDVDYPKDSDSREEALELLKVLFDHDRYAQSAMDLYFKVEPDKLGEAEMSLTDQSVEETLDNAIEKLNAEGVDAGSLPNPKENLLKKPKNWKQDKPIHLDPEND